VASNDTPEGRARNRRVVLVIMSGADARVSERLNHLQTTREGELLRPQSVQGALRDESTAGRTGATL
jgi:hypothetical protein